MTMAATMTPEDAALAAEYAMGLLTGNELRMFEARLRRDDILLGEVQDWQEHLSAMTDDIDVRPPRSVKKQLQKRLFGTPRRALVLWQALTGAAATACVVLVLLFFAQPAPQPDPIYAAEIVAEDESLRVLAVFDGDNLRLSRTAGAPRPGRAFELWLIAGDDAPVSLGVITDATNSVTQVPDDMRLAFATGVLAISDEPLGGSPTGQPTGDVLAIGPITAL